MEKALHIALEALEKISMGGDPRRADLAITAIKAALETKDDPLAYLPPTASPENACYNPPQRKPLTDMDIAIIDWESLVTRKDCVRAIEAAHGIKGEA